MEIRNEVLNYVSPGKVERKASELEPLKHTEVLARACCSGISPGTERLVHQGQIEPGMPLDATISTLKDGSLQYPFSYGYCWVGVVEACGPSVHSLQPGDRVFAFAPHQSYLVEEASAFIQLPPALSDSAATLIPTMETALSIVHDTRPLAGEDICIFGQGLVGLMTGWLLSQFPLNSLKAIDPCAERHPISVRLGLDAITTPEHHDAQPQADVSIEVSGNPAALNQALATTRSQGRVIVASWYGSQTTELSLGTHFHRGRIQILSSQVSNINPDLRGLWSKKRRLGQAIQLLERFPHDALTTNPIDFYNAENTYPAVFGRTSHQLHPYFTYSGN